MPFAPESYHRFGIFSNGIEYGPRAVIMQRGFLRFRLASHLGSEVPRTDAARLFHKETNMTQTAAPDTFRDQIADWPPSVVEGKRGLTYPLKREDAVIDEPVTTDGELVRFYVIYECQRVLCSFQAPSIDVSKEQARILRANRGKTVASM